MVEKKLKLSNGKEIIVREDGKLFNLEHHEYSIWIDKFGYCSITSGTNRYLVHRLVAEAFLSDYRNERSLQVHHKDFNKSNNAVSNLICMEYMKSITDNFFDLAIVDPPYGIKAPKMVMGGGFSGGKYNSCKFKENKKAKIKENESEYTWDNIPPDEYYFKELFRVSKNQIIWGGNYFCLPPTRCVIAWDKCQPWENFSQIEMAWTSYDKPAKLYRQINSGSNCEKKIHPTQKPVELYKYLLNTFGEPFMGQKIFDSHLGSGNSRIAAYEYGFDFYACELNKTYFDKQEERFKKFTEQQLLDFGD